MCLAGQAISTSASCSRAQLLQAWAPALFPHQQWKELCCSTPHQPWGRCALDPVTLMMHTVASCCFPLKYMHFDSLSSQDYFQKSSRNGHKIHTQRTRYFKKSKQGLHWGFPGDPVVKNPCQRNGYALDPQQEILPCHGAAKPKGHN